MTQTSERPGAADSGPIRSQSFVGAKIEAAPRLQGGTVTAYDRFIGRVRDNGKLVRERGSGQASAQCPAHDDRDPSLSIRRIEGQTLVYCHAGCDSRDVLGALGMTMSDLFDNPNGATYSYDDGRQVHRTPNKQFRQSGNTKGTAQLYRASAVAEAVRNGTVVAVVEGEKDVHALESLGVVATTAPMGAANWSKVDPSPLHGGKIAVIPDADESGQRWAQAVRTSLVGKVESLWFMGPKVGKDAADHVAAGYGLTEFTRLEPPEPHPEAMQAESRRARITWADEIEPEPVRWAWKTGDDGRIPSGSLSIAAGREGTGKSSFGISISAQITNGTLPGCFFGKPRRVLYLAVEDSWKYTLVPRLMAAGADRSRVGRFDIITDEGDEVILSLPHDNSLLERSIIENEIALVVIDPIMSVITQKIDTHRTHEVRQALDPLAKLADRTGCVILGIAHFNKASGTDAASLLSGSHAFRDVPRSIFGFARDDSDGTRVMTQVKNSLGRDDLPSLTYAMEGAVVDTKLGPAETARFVFGAESDRSVADVLRESRSDAGDPEERRDAATWIKAYLTEAGGTAQVKDVLAAGKGVGYAEQTLKNARRKVADTDRSGFGSEQVHTWILRTGTTTGTAGTTHKEVVPAVSQAVPVDSSGALDDDDDDDDPCPSCDQPFDRPNPRCSAAAWHGEGAAL
jgi:hypothetical protein